MEEEPYKLGETCALAPGGLRMFFFFFFKWRCFVVEEMMELLGFSKFYYILMPGMDTKSMITLGTKEFVKGRPYIL